MSAKATAWAWAQDVTGMTKLVLLTLADVANQENETWYTRKHLAERATVSIATLDRAIRELELRDLVVCENRKRDDGSLSSSLYRLMVGTITQIVGTSLQMVGTVPLIDHESNSESNSESSSKPPRKQRNLELRATFIDEACVKYPQWPREKVERLVDSAVNYYLPEMRKGKYQDLNLCVWNNLADKAEKELANGTHSGHPPLSQFTRGAGSQAPVGRTEAERYAARVTRYQNC